MAPYFPHRVFVHDGQPPLLFLNQEQLRPSKPAYLLSPLPRGKAFFIATGERIRSSTQRFLGSFVIPIFDSIEEYIAQYSLRFFGDSLHQK